VMNIVARWPGNTGDHSDSKAGQNAPRTIAAFRSAVIDIKGESSSVKTASNPAQTPTIHNRTGAWRGAGGRIGAFMLQKWQARRGGASPVAGSVAGRVPNDAEGRSHDLDVGHKAQALRIAQIHDRAQIKRVFVA